MSTLVIHADSFDTLLGDLNYLEMADGSRFWRLRDIRNLTHIDNLCHAKDCKMIAHPLTGKVYYYLPTVAMINLLMSNVSDSSTLFVIKALLFEHLEPLTGYTLYYERVREGVDNPEDVKFARSLIPS